MEFSSFPKNLAYAVKTLSGFSKSTVKLLPDNRTDTVTSGNIIRVRLPQNSLIDLRTFTMYYQGIVTVNQSGGKGHYPRLSSSIIDTLTIYVNGTQIENIQNYNLLYNTLYDLEVVLTNKRKDVLKMLTQQYFILLRIAKLLLQRLKLLHTTPPTIVLYIASLSSIIGWVS